MNKYAFAAAVFAVLTGAAGYALGKQAGTAAPSVPAATPGMSSMRHDMPGMDMGGSSMSMSEMTSGLAGLSGDEFDRKFLSEMIAHHQGAVEMAAMAKDQAKHQEIKDLSEGITAAQASEIARMRAWQEAWGYGG